MISFKDTRSENTDSARVIEAIGVEFTHTVSLNMKECMQLNTEAIGVEFIHTMSLNMKISIQAFLLSNKL
jgi:hypothetical protein